MFGRCFTEGAAADPMEHLYFDEGLPMSEPFFHQEPERRGRSTFRLAGRLVEPSLNRVTHDGAVAQVEPKVMQVLEVLVEGAGDVVAKEDLIRRVWDGVFVTDDVLVRAVRELRKVFEDGAEPPAVIETIRKRGYRLVAPVIYEMASEPSRAFTVAPATATAPRPVTPPRRPWIVGGMAFAVALGLITAFLAQRRPTSAPAVAGQPRFLPFTTLDGNEFAPAVSPDGTRVVFAWEGPSGPSRDLYVKLLGSEEMLRLTNDAREKHGVVWSGDGTQIAYVSQGSGVCDLMSVSALGGPTRRIGPCERPRARFALSADGRQVVVSRRTGEGWRGRLFLRDLDGSGEQTLTSAEEGDFVDSSPAFSPDGHLVAFTRWITDSVGDLYVVAAAGGSPRRLTTDNADTMGFTWAGNDRLVFSSNRAGMYSLWGVGLDGGAPVLVAGGGRKIKHPSASRDGNVIAYEGWNYDMNLATLEAPFSAGTSPRVLATATDEWTYEPRLATDGSRLVFTSTRSGSYEIWTAAADGTSPFRLTNFGGPYVGSPRLSPDGRSVVFVARPDGQADVYTVDLDGRGPHRLTNDAADDLAPSYSADGRAVYFASRRTGDWQIHRTDRSTGVTTAVTEQGGFAALESEDGAWLYHDRNDRGGLWRRRAGAPPEEPSELVEAAVPAGDAAGFGVLPKGAYYWVAPATDTTPARVMFRQPPLAPRVLTALPGMAWSGVDVSPDGKRVLYSRIGRNDSNIVVMRR